MNIHCILFGAHDWSKDCEKCSQCGRKREGEHDWAMDCEKCSKCGSVRERAHDWAKDCEKCSRCGKVRERCHDWAKDCEKCSRCGMVREHGHDWAKDCEKCTRCGKVREHGHDWSKDCEKCSRCGKVREGLHKWLSGRCAVCDLSIDEPRQEGLTRLALASARGLTQQVHDLLKAGASPAAPNREDMGPLMWAAQNGHKEIVDCLLQAGADVNARTNVRNTALMLAADRGHSEIVRVLVDAGSDVNAADVDGCVVLQGAVQGGCDAPAVELLLSKGADVHAGTPKGDSILSCAVAGGRMDLVDLFLVRGLTLKPDPNQLVAAAVNGNVELMKRLLDQGGNVNANVSQYNLTPLLAASAYGRLEMVKFLVARGADTTARDKLGNTAMGLAQMKRHTSTVEFLKTLTSSPSVPAKPTLQKLSHTGIAGRRLREITLEPSSRYRIKIGMTLLMGARMTETLTFETDANAEIGGISSPATSRDLLLHDCDLLAIQHISSGLTVGDLE